MEEATPQPGKPDIPPPSIPSPDLPPSGEKPHSTPPPDLKPAEPPPSAGGGPPVVNVRIREAGDPVEASLLANSFAPFNTRASAAFIDLVLAIGLHLAAYWILPGFAEGLAWLVGVGYIIARDSLPIPGKQSVGKKVMNIRATTIDDQDLTGNWQAAFIRNGVLLIPFFAFVELYVLLSREEGMLRGRRLGDEWAKTRVMMAPEPPEEPEQGV